MGRCKYHDTDYDCCVRYSTIGGAHQHLVPCHKCELFVPITNYDHIKAMSKEELAETLSQFCLQSDDCEHCIFEGRCPETHYVNAWLIWLNSEVEE